MTLPDWLNPGSSPDLSPAEKLRSFEAALRNYKKVHDELIDFRAFVAREGTTVSAEADSDHTDLLKLKVEAARDVLAATALIAFDDGLFERCAEILEFETAGRP
ncbi:hypothetical protein BOO69_09505 [Sulfitobacter alexandrii]|uniref:Uncharacterized protein n=1 Tax=Sulfitobacter alexandrii TaxID=1917485 RepID=A0A1J0WHM2_9RHOB|nr:hypothetical protein [Sulfitobacter alexandrii]APE43622.1 hypothetical protein BOO69_09505 [Sulfitobacter alexandrii]